MTRTEDSRSRSSIRSATGLLRGAVATVLLAGLPLVGIAINREPVAVYLEFPPLTQHVHHAPFSWLAFVALATGILAAVTPFILRSLRFGANDASGRDASCGPFGTSSHAWLTARPFPAWGWTALVFGLVAWVLAWTRFEWFAPLQRFTFSPLWFAYIGVVNALTFRRTGRCLLTGNPRYMAGLFIVSAAFWWYFEYLNRFVQNWYYVNCDGLSPLQYFIFATLPFSTVLPAVMSTSELLASFPGFARPFTRFAPIGPRHPRALAAVVLLSAACGLALLAVYPDFLFPLLWLSPLLVLTSLDILADRSTILSPLRSGDWSRIVILAVAALICGFFWEMWNFRSLARWIYTVPFVQAFHVFEMPILGYAGYLPFGLECAVIADRVAAASRQDPARKEEPS